MTGPADAGRRAAGGRARPFLKWAGGKTQLLPAIEARLPAGLLDGTINAYVEPFLGSGAVFFALASRFRFRRVLLLDRNPDLVLVYRVVRDHVGSLIGTLAPLADAYRGAGPAERRALYDEVRARFNAGAQGEVERAAALLFLNRTCYNGLYRVNADGGFNVPHGRYANPGICRTDTLRAASSALASVEIREADFEACAAVADRRTFVYLDPPYRPLSPTSSFTGYAVGGFSDAEQERLERCCVRLDRLGARFLLSNSDPTNADPADRFFDDLYRDFVVERIPARRAINSDVDRRGPVRELLVRNYR